MYSFNWRCANVLHEVYKMFELGQKHTVDVVKSVAPATGELSLLRGTAQLTSGPDRVATLTKLGGCVVIAINAEGAILIKGTESIVRKPAYKSQFDDYPQEWLCKPVDPTVRRR